MFQLVSKVFVFCIFLANSVVVAVRMVPPNDDLFRITGGHLFDDRNYAKHIVSIRSAHERMFYGDNHLCGGTIIAPDIILTAAHCLVHSKTGKRKEPYEVTVVAGSIYRLKRTPEAVTLKVRKVIVHGGYKTYGFELDIGILKLAEEIVEDNNHTERLAVTRQPLHKSTECTALGWGRVLSGGPVSPIVLYANVTVWPLGLCRSVFPNMYFSPGIVCASDEYDSHLTSATCSGDSGGPLICNGVVSGIVSFGGQVCGQKGIPTAFTDVYFFRRWIEIKCSSNAFTVNKQVIVLMLLIVVYLC